MTFILVTHNQEEALIMSDRIAVMFEGTINQLATPQQLYRGTVSRKVAEFIGIMNFLPAQVLSVENRTAELEVAGLGRAALPEEQCPGGAKTGPASIGFRPETMTVLYDDDPAPRSGRVVEGTVAEVLYYGDMTYYEIQFDGAESEKPVSISMRNVVGRSVYERGHRARIALDPGALVLFG